MTTQAFYRSVTKTSREEDPNVVKRATAAGLHALRDRLTMDEADEVFAQLPTELWRSGVRARSPNASPSR